MLSHPPSPLLNVGQQQCLTAPIPHPYDSRMRSLLLFILLAILQSRTEVVAAVAYTDLAKHYSLEPPKGFVEFCAAHNNPKPNTCAIRLSAALYKMDRKFFDDVTFPAGYGWKPLDADRELATRAASLAKIITKGGAKEKP